MRIKLNLLVVDVNKKSYKCFKGYKGFKIIKNERKIFGIGNWKFGAYQRKRRASWEFKNKFKL
jgi:hypothetical protein